MLTILSLGAASLDFLELKTALCLRVATSFRPMASQVCEAQPVVRRELLAQERLALP